MQNMNWLNTFYAAAADFGMKVVFALAILLIGRWCARLVSLFVERSLNKSKLNPTLANFLKNIVYFTLLIFVFIAALNKLGVETTSFVALIGAAGLAVGLALQGSLANFAAGVMIVVFHPFDVGDTIDVGGAVGIVKDIQIFNIILTAPDDRLIILPNARVTSDKIIVTKKF